MIAGIRNRDAVTEPPMGWANGVPSEKTGFLEILHRVGETLDQARTAGNEVQVSLGREIELLEADLIRTTLERNRTALRADAEKMRADELDKQLGLEKQKGEVLSLRTYILAGEVENAVRSKGDVQSRLDASEARRRTLEREGRLKDLRIMKIQLEKEEAERDGGLFKVVGSATSSGFIAGTFIAGPLGAVVVSGIALTSSTVVALLFSDSERVEICRNKLLEVEREIYGLTRNNNVAC
jgi:hypothetical protein